MITLDLGHMAAPAAQNAIHRNSTVVRTWIKPNLLMRVVCLKFKIKVI